MAPAVAGESSPSGFPVCLKWFRETAANMFVEFCHLLDHVCPITTVVSPRGSVSPAGCKVTQSQVRGPFPAGRGAPSLPGGGHQSEAEPWRVEGRGGRESS